MMWICIITWLLIKQKFQNPKNNTDAATSFLPYQTKVKAEAQIRFFQAIFFLPASYYLNHIFGWHLILTSTISILKRKKESEVAQSCLTLWTPMNCNLPGSFEYWSGLPFPSPEDLLDPLIEPRSPTLQADTLPSQPLGKPKPKLGTGQNLYFVSCDSWEVKREKKTEHLCSYFQNHSYFKKSYKNPKDILV